MATVVVIAQGEMGAGIASRLTAQGARVLTSLLGRSAASAARAAKAGMVAVEDDARLVAEADFVLSVVPPGDASALAERLAPALSATRRKPIFVECNAISPRRAAEVAAVIAPTGAPFVDGGIIGGPPQPQQIGARIYVSGPEAAKVAALRDFGLDIRLVEGPIGKASALKCAYAALTKGTTAIGAAMMLGALRSHVVPELHAEFAASQPELAGRMVREVPRMYHKAYRWVAEMEEIADFLSADPGAGEMYRGIARLYEQVAQDSATIPLLNEFIGQKAK